MHRIALLLLVAVILTACGTTPEPVSAPTAEPRPTLSATEPPPESAIEPAPSLQPTESAGATLPETTHELAQASIRSADGGAVQLEDGARLVVPPNALSRDGQVLLERTTRDLSDLPPVPEAVIPVSPFYDLRLEGAEIASPLLLELPYDPHLLPSGLTADEMQQHLSVAFPKDTYWVHMHGQIDQRRQTLSIPITELDDPIIMWHFSYLEEPGAYIEALSADPASLPAKLIDGRLAADTPIRLSGNVTIPSRTSRCADELGTPAVSALRIYWFLEHQQGWSQLRGPATVQQSIANGGPWTYTLQLDEQVDPEIQHRITSIRFTLVLHGVIDESVSPQHSCRRDAYLGSWTKTVPLLIEETPPTPEAAAANPACAWTAILAGGKWQRTDLGPPSGEYVQFREDGTVVSYAADGTATIRDYPWSCREDGTLQYFGDPPYVIKVKVIDENHVHWSYMTHGGSLQNVDLERVETLP